ncbi:magnesium and cobalt transport protein CorA [Fulvimarina endophytica]|uniref:Magnesium transport protein CorA n=1 Tax=Fulvimarina endophytica TaxID=2293836 RepID=A0A371X9W0_9HYPH|nr:magnesium/cobalt transporter CorA [Fulvimarina endophytica]RFC66028.1 magnesium and cobalt transport protein CorA [Fulvimarina endophytica]
MAFPTFGQKRRRKRRSEKAKRSEVGAPPGELVADPEAEASTLSVFGIGNGRHERIENTDIETALAKREEWPLVWIDLSGLSDIDLVRRIGSAFGLHDLALEDVVNTDQRPKCDAYENHTFFVMRMIDTEGRSKQFSMFFGDGFVLSFQESKGRDFEQVRKRIEKGAPRLHTGRSDYLAYALIDTVVDTYFLVMDPLTEKIDRLEEEIFEDVDVVQVPELHAMRRDLLHMKRLIRPTRDALNALIRLDRPWLSEETKVYLADVQDHCDQLIDIDDTYRDNASGLVDLHMTLTAAKTNEVINLLTFVSAIFIPLGFLAGLWGMNFDPTISPWNMPLTQSPFGYPIALGIMLVIAIGLLVYFKKKKWI